MAIGDPYLRGPRCTSAASRRSRRELLRTSVAIGVGGLVALAVPSILRGGPASPVAPAVAAEEPPGVSADEALARLMEGNARFAAALPSYPDQTPERRTTVAGGQHPIAVVVGCSDSRVAPELAFDQGLGDLFVIRVAGNVVDDNALGSVEYALAELHVPLVVVLGHGRCGAVKATLDLAVQGGEAPGHIQSLVKAIQPAVAQARTQGGDTLDAAIIANVGHVVGLLKTSEPIVGKLVDAEQVKIVGARYDLDTGQVAIVA